MEEKKKKTVVKKGKDESKVFKREGRITDFWKKYPKGTVKILDMTAVLQ
jgi:hypothetical protein